MENPSSPEIGVNEDPLKVSQELTQSWGTDYHRIRALICRLTDGAWYSISDLISLSAISHWNITHLLQLLGDWIEQKEDRVRFRSDCIAMVTRVFDCANVPDESFLPLYEVAARAGQAAGQSQALLRSMTQLVTELPISPVRHLDHVSATPLTCVQRALFLAKNYELTGAKILFLGDHDLTSLALALVRPDVAMAVVDVDERILAYIGEMAYRHGWNIRTIFADFRIDLPRSLIECFDLVFTDPPYTPGGMSLFLKRGIESLKDTDYARVLFCYGFSERHPALAYKVQSAVFDLRLVTEAILPQFNRYTGAQAIASSAALYICRPTRRSLPAAEAVKVDPRIYTQGKHAEEAATEGLSGSTVNKVKHLLMEHEDEKLTLVGDSWPKEMPRMATKTSLTGYLHSMYNTRGTSSGIVALNLYPHYNAYLVRVLLVASSEYIIISVADDVMRSIFNQEKNDAVRTLIESKFQVLSLERGNAGQPTIMQLKQIPSPEDDGLRYVLRYLVDHRHAKLLNAWREALISWSSRQGESLSKNQARQQLEQSKLAQMHSESYLSELSLADLKILVNDLSSWLDRESKKNFL